MKVENKDVKPKVKNETKSLSQRYKEYIASLDWEAIPNLILSCSHVICIIVIAIILALNDGDCDNPIRLWLTVSMYVLIGHFPILLSA